MNNNDAAGKAPQSPISFPFYYGWFIVALSFLANLTAAGIRSAPSVLIHPLEAEFGWSRTAIASAASLNLLLLGLFAPIGGWLIDRVGARRVILGCLMTISVGLVGTVFVRELWQLIVCGASSWALRPGQPARRGNREPLVRASARSGHRHHANANRRVSVFCRC